MGMYQARPVPILRGCALLLLSGAVLVAPTTVIRANTISCGATVLADLTLDQDLTCSGPGLVVGVDGIEIDLNGHSITGSGTGAGILVSGRADVSIRGGTLVNFTAGVQVINSSGVSIQANMLVSNADGIDLQAGSTDITIKENAFLNNRARGVMLRGGTGDNTVKENQFAGNRVGILVNGAMSSTVKGNDVETSGQFGIRVIFPATGNVLSDNIVSSNPVGIDFVAGTDGPPVGNVFHENTISSNVCGLKGPFSGNRFKDNVFSGNGSDTCP
jgi:parallel beta-helix repeat protein